MKILQLTKKFPFPLKDGESIAITNLAKGMQSLGCEISLLSMNTRKHYFDVDQLPQDFNHYKKVHSVLIDNEIRWTDALLNLFSEDSYHIARFVSEKFNQKLIEILQKETFDVIQLETLYLAPYIETIRKYSNAIVAMRAHNVEHEIWERIAQNTPEIWKKWYLSHLTDKLKRYEKEQLDAYDILVPITEKDLHHFQNMGFKNGAKVTPIGVDYAEHTPDYSVFEKELSLSFIGSLDWMPNQEGLTWFLEQVWPLITKKYPKLVLHIAGRNCPDWIRELENQNVKIHGEVACAAQFVNKHPLTIVPLLSGSGMRAKILEGMALGKVVITTSIGLEGIQARDKREVLIANTPEAFLESIDFCVKNQDKLVKIGQYAHAFVHNRYDNMQIAHRLVEAYHEYVNATV